MAGAGAAAEHYGRTRKQSKYASLYQSRYNLICFGLETSGIIAAYRRLSGGILGLIESLNLMTGSFVANLSERNPARLQKIIFFISLLGTLVALSAFPG